MAGLSATRNRSQDDVRPRRWSEMMDELEASSSLHCEHAQNHVIGYDDGASERLSEPTTASASGDEDNASGTALSGCGADALVSSLYSPRGTIHTGNVARDPWVPQREGLRPDAIAYQPMTSIMVKNIPCSFKRKHIAQVLNSVGLYGRYDNIHVTMNPKQTSNMGYFFVNFLTVEDANFFWITFNGRPFGQSKSAKIVEVSWAKTQRQTEKVAKGQQFYGWQDWPFWQAEQAW